MSHPMDCGGDSFAVPFRERVVHAEGTKLSVCLSIAVFLDDVRTLSCYL